MMMNLFSIFDPSLVMFSFSWLISLFVILLIPSMFWSTGLFVVFLKELVGLWIKEVNYSVNKPAKGVYKFLAVIFICVLLYNFFAIFPYIFSVTSHLLVTFPFSYSFWLGIIFFSFYKSFKSFLIHLIPVGTPVGLISFMVIVEILSNFIRPMALTFRLTANMMAGHLLMSLIGGAVISLPFYAFFVGSLAQSLLVFMELGVSVIQAYVFSTLLLLYLSESESSH